MVSWTSNAVLQYDGSAVLNWVYPECSLSVLSNTWTTKEPWLFVDTEAFQNVSKINV